MMMGSGALAVLLATYNGSAFLDEQLRSVEQQDWAHIDIWASDDGSTDRTQAILAHWAGSWRKGGFTLLNGPRDGFAANFRALLANPDVDADYVAFCDQDDIWLPDKTRVAAELLAPHGDRPALYCSRTIIVDAQGRELQRSPLFRRQPDFANALVQSISGGNTMVMNRAGHRLLREAARRTGFVSHDWFSYLIVSGAGGAVIYSETPHVLYRQHDRNLVGSNHGWNARLERARMAFGGRFARWNEANIAALCACRDLLSPEATAIFERFSRARSAPLPARMIDLWRSGVHRQTAMGQLSLYAAGLLGKL